MSIETLAQSALDLLNNDLASIEERAVEAPPTGEPFIETLPLFRASPYFRRVGALAERNEVGGFEWAYRFPTVANTELFRANLPEGIARQITRQSDGLIRCIVSIATDEPHANLLVNQTSTLKIDIRRTGAASSGAVEFQRNEIWDEEHWEGFYFELFVNIAADSRAGEFNEIRLIGNSTNSQARHIIGIDFALWL